MKINYKVGRTAAFFLMIVLLIGFQACKRNAVPENKSLSAAQGIIDLKNWETANMKYFKLDGEWELYWNKLLEPKDFPEGSMPEKTGYLKMPFEWKNESVGGMQIDPHGFATYRLVIKNVEPNMLYALRIPYIDTSYKLWSNGVLVAQNGRVGTDKKDSMPRTEPKVTTVYSKNDEIVLILQESNFYKRESRSRSIEFGMHDDIYKDRNKALMMEVFLFGATLIMGFYYMGNFLYRKKEKANLYFSLLCFLIAARTIVIGETILYILVPSINWQLLQKIAYLANYIVLPIFVLFLSEVFSDEIPKKTGYILSFVCGILSLIVILTPQMIFDVTLPFFEVISIISLLYILYGLIKARINKREGAETVLFGFLFITITVVNDILFDRQYAGTRYLFPVGAFVFVLCQTFILSKRFSNAFSRQEELLKTNSELITAIEKEKEALRNEMQSRLTAERLLNEAVQYDKIKNDFFANISHEFRTPINVILSSIQMSNIILNKTGNEIDIAKLNRYINIMKQNSFRLIKLINNLIDITKIDAGYYKLSLCNCNIISVVEEITMSVAEYIRDKGIELIFDTDVEEKIIACDPEKIERIILNLLSNAVKFTDPGGHIYVTVNVYFDRVKVSVKDTGIGIPKEKLEKIFERFVQVDNTLSRNHEGSGIGLSLVKSLVEMHGGTIKALSEQGEGSEFVFEIPSKTIIDEVQSEVKQCSEPGNIERISVEFSDIY